MIHPGYLLNPGDMFSVDPERVLFATGARKDQPWTAGELERTASSRDPKRTALQFQAHKHNMDEGSEEELEDIISQEVEDVGELALETALQKELQKRIKLVWTSLKAYHDRQKRIMAISGKQKQRLRSLLKEVKTTMSRIQSATESSIQALEDSAAAFTNTPLRSDSETTDDVSTIMDHGDGIIDGAETSMNVTTDRDEDSSSGDSKPYRIPWRPRDYMAAFTFVPRYLEVNQKICSAIYLRHPVARPGLAEVPTPVSHETSQLAFNWYLRRR
jgi:hypothetical protein